MTARTLLTGTAIVSVGLMAGLLYGWMVSVIPGLSRISDQNYISTMQSINVAIINPAFVIPFILTPVILGIAGLVEYRAGNHRRGWLLGAAAITYVVGVLGVTAGGNIPLNNALDAFDLETASVTKTATERSGYEGAWNRWHLVRTIGNTVALVLAAAAALTTTE